MDPNESSFISKNKNLIFKSHFLQIKKSYHSPRKLSIDCFPPPKKKNCVSKESQS